MIFILWVMSWLVMVVSNMYYYVMCVVGVYVGVWAFV